MPHKYRIDTDHGSYEVEVDSPSTVPAASLAEGFRSAGSNGQTEDEYNAPPNALKGMLSGSAHPQGLGDLLSLLIPSGVAEAGSEAARMLRTGYRYAKAEPAVASSSAGLVRSAVSPLAAKLRGFMRGMTEEAVPSNIVDKMLPRGAAIQNVGAASASVGPDLIDKYRSPSPPDSIDRMLGRSGAPIQNVGKPPTSAGPDLIDKYLPGRPAVNPLPSTGPLYDERIPGEISNLKPPVEAPPRVPVADPLDEALQKLPANIRSRIIGPGTPGRPAVPSSQLVDQAITRQLGSGTDRPMSAGVPPSAAAVSSPPTQAPPLALLTKKAADLSPVEWQSIRRHYGSVKAGELMGVSPQDVVRLSGGGPSQIPIEVEDRIRQASAQSDPLK